MEIVPEIPNQWRESAPPYALARSEREWLSGVIDQKVQIYISPTTVNEGKGRPQVNLLLELNDVEEYKVAALQRYGGTIREKVKSPPASEMRSEQITIFNWSLTGRAAAQLLSSLQDTLTLKDKAANLCTQWLDADIQTKLHLAEKFRREKATDKVALKLKPINKGKITQSYIAGALDINGWANYVDTESRSYISAGVGFRNRYLAEYLKEVMGGRGSIINGTRWGGDFKVAREFLMEYQDYTWLMREKISETLIKSYAKQKV
jgi:hypothetical protein